MVALKRLGWILVVATLALPAVALAGSSDTSDCACGWTSAGWDAPNGAVVRNRSEGPVKFVIDTLFEGGTHSMMSHGPAIAHVSHATMHSPGTEGWPDCCSDGPMRPDELRAGFPGLSQVNQGAIYTSLYAGHAPEWIRTQIPTAGTTNRALAENTANWLWYSAPWQWVPSKQNSSYGLYRVGVPGASTFTPNVYTLFQYRDWQNAGGGNDARWINGLTCSSSISWANAKANGIAIGGYLYSHATIVAAGNALYGGVENACDDSLGFWGGVGTSIACFESICDDAGRQVRNCMAYGGCGSDSDTTWNAIASDPSAVAVSLSPDDLLGWSGHCYYEGQTGCKGAPQTVGPWAPYGYTPTQWNSGGAVYGCWF